MNKKKLNELLNWALPTGLEVDAVTGVIFGQKEGYSFYIEELQEGKQYSITFSLAKDGQVPENKAFVFLTKQDPSLLSATVRQHKVAFLTKPQMLKKKGKERILPALMAILAYIQENGFENCDESTGQVAPTAAYMISGTVHLLTEKSFAEKNSEVDMAYQEANQTSENVFLGSIGAFLGSLVGVLIIVLIGLLGRISIISGLGMGVATIKGYQLLGKKLSKKGVIISIVFMLIAVFVANQIDFSISLVRAFSEETGQVYSFIDIYSNLGTILDSIPDLQGTYYTNLVLSYIITSVGAGAMVKQEIDRYNFKHITRKLSMGI